MSGLSGIAGSRQPAGVAAPLATLAVVDLATRAATAYQRPDLARRLVATRRRLSDPAFHVLVVGEFKQGKSSLINALLRAPVCPVDDDVATAVPTAVGWAEAPRAALVYEPPGEAGDGEPPREEIPIGAVAAYVTEAANPGNQRRLRAVEVGVPRPILESGLVLVDTPGVGGLGSIHSTTTIGALPLADALLFVSDASQEYSQPELEFLATARQLCPNVTCLLTKVDFYPEWRTILELDRAHLEAARVRAAIIPVSSTLHVQSLELNDAELDAESGFPTLTRHVLDEVVANAERLSVRVTAATLSSVVVQLEGQFESERQALADPARVQALMGRLQVAREQADRLRTQAAKWQQTLGDGIADLTSDVDHDLRARAREVLREADEAIEASDPADVWDEFEPWLYRRVTEEVAQNYTLLHRRAAELGGHVARHFDADRDEIGVTLDPGAPAQALDSVKARAGVDLDQMGFAAQGMAVMRGGYGGMLMFGMLGGLVTGAATMIAPWTVPIGLLMGRKSMRDEKERQLSMRRGQAKNAVRKYVDEASFNVGKDSRDTLRRVQRQLRDHFAELADELHRSTTEALLAAQKAATVGAEEREKRLRDVEAELGRIADLRVSVVALSPDLASA